MSYILNPFFEISKESGKIILRNRFSDDVLLKWNGVSIDVNNMDTQEMLITFQNYLKINLLISSEDEKLFMQRLQEYFLNEASPNLSSLDASYNLLKGLHHTQIDRLAYKGTLEISNIWKPKEAKNSIGILMYDNYDRHSMIKEMLSRSQQYQCILFLTGDEKLSKIGPFIEQRHFNEFNFSEILNDDVEWNSEFLDNDLKTFGIDDYRKNIIAGMIIEYLNGYVFGVSPFHNKIAKIIDSKRIVVSEVLPLS